MRSTPAGAENILTFTYRMNMLRTGINDGSTGKSPKHLKAPHRFNQENQQQQQQQYNIIANQFVESLKMYTNCYFQNDAEHWVVHKQLLKMYKLH